jgi:lysophospholipase
VIAHSTGGAVALRSLTEHAWFSKAVLVAPLIGLNYGGWPRPVVVVLLALFRALGLSRAFLIGQRRRPMGTADFQGNPLSSDNRRWRRDSEVLEVAPQLGIGGATFGWLTAARKAMKALEKLGPKTKLTAPLLIIAAGRDRVIAAEAIARFTHRVPGVARTVITESLHEILSERDDIRAQFWAVFDNFVGERTGK